MARTTAAAKEKKAPGKRIAAKTAEQEPSKQLGKAHGHKSRLSMVRALIETWSKELEQHKTKSGVAELIRLLTLEKELSVTNQAVREIKVSWVEPKATESSKSE